MIMFTCLEIWAKNTFTKHGIQSYYVQFIFGNMAYVFRFVHLNESNFYFNIFNLFSELDFSNLDYPPQGTE